MKTSFLICLAMVASLFCHSQSFAYTDSLTANITREAARCYIGHSFAKSDDFKAGKANKYLTLLLERAGPEDTQEVLMRAENDLDVKEASSQEERERQGNHYIKDNCASVDRAMIKFNL
ncbi:MAG: hypothetical protein QNL04_00310 [SAR324 cluster bacterium]|nr:hypothetical protein [SAR324 cluster bacterium]